MGGALTIHLARAGHDVAVLTTPFDAPFVEAHERRAPHPALAMPLPDAIEMVPADRWPDVLPKSDRILLAVATAGLADTVAAAAPHARPDAVWAVATKGWDEATMLSAASLVAETLGDPSRVVAVVGPSLAAEIAQGVPTGVVCASEGAHAARHVAEMLDTPAFRTYTSDDVAGVEVAAIMKNVVAVAIGMCDGLCAEFGVEAMTNAKAFVFSRGLVETAKLARALGGRAETILGLAGAGDLFVNALGGRNARFGRLVGGGLTPEQALDEMKTTVEGHHNARTTAALAAKHGLTLPVVDVVAKVLHYGMSPRDAIARLFAPGVEEELGG